MEGYAKRTGARLTSSTVELELRVGPMQCDRVGEYDRRQGSNILQRKSTKVARPQSLQDKCHTPHQNEARTMLLSATRSYILI